MEQSRINYLLFDLPLRRMSGPNETGAFSSLASADLATE
jgi:hypothetical protein